MPTRCAKLAGFHPALSLHVAIPDESALAGAATGGRPAIGLVIRILDKAALAALAVRGRSKR